MRKILVVTGSRAEYGLLYWLLREIEEADDLELQLVVTGMHLSTEFGLTYRKIEEDGFTISRKIEMLLSSDTASGITKSMGVGLIGFADVFEKLQPHIVVMLGDRFELLCAASAALVATLPIAHIHGGELTLGAFDDGIRHSITKMAQIHFTATEIYRQRVIQLGEDPNRVFNFGAPGLDNVRRLELLDRHEFEEAIGLDLGTKSLLVTWHPVTLAPGKNKIFIQDLLDALDALNDVKIIFTKANADTEGRIINQMISDYVGNRKNQMVVHTSLGQTGYLSALRHVDGVVGNSSSGIIEAPSFGIGTVNIGDRQQGRVRASSIIDCDPNVESIKAAISKLFSMKFQTGLQDVVNPHGVEPVSEKIVDVLRHYPLDGLLKKSFHDLSIS